jgi:predicted PurR-regulated permease PerM
LLAIDPKAARVTWTVAITLVLLAAIYAIRGTLVVFAVALLVAYLLHPLVGQLSRPFPLKSRTLALALTYVVVMGVLAAIGIVIGSRVVGEARHLILNPPDTRGFLDRLMLAHPALSPMLQSVRGSIDQQVGQIVTAVPHLTQELLAASANLIYLIVIPILSFFILKDGLRIRDAFLVAFTAGEKRDRVARALAEVHVLLLQYMRALLTLCCTALIVIGAGLSLMGVHYALLLAALSFFCEFVPMVGPIAEIVVILTVSALTGYSHMWWLAAGLGVFRLVQDYGIWPRLMSRGIELQPLWVIFGVFAGGQLGGVAGVFFAVPVLALVRLTLIHVGKKPIVVDSSA